MTLAETIKKRRKELHKTQDDIAKVVKVTKQTIQKYENGIISNIPSDKIELLAIALECTPGYLMGWNDNKNNVQANRTEEENEIIELFSKLPIEKKKLVIDLIKNLSDK